MAKLIAVNNRTTGLLHLVSTECAGDNRLLPPGTSLVLGQHDEGADFPTDPKYSILIKGDDGAVLWTLREENRVVVSVAGGTSKVVLDSMGRAFTSPGIILHVEKDKITAAPMKMPALAIPKLCYLRNCLPQRLILESKETAGDNAGNIYSGEWTPILGQYNAGVDIPECRSASTWNTRRLRIAPNNGRFEINIYRVGYDIFHSFGPDYPAEHVPLPGGQSQGDGHTKSLIVLADKEVQLVNTPADIQNGVWGNWPNPSKDQTVVHASVELMVDYEVKDGTPQPVHRYATRIEIRDHENGVISGLKAQISATPTISAVINGRAYDVPEEAAPLTLEPSLDGVFTITHQAGTLGAPIFHVKVIRPGKPAEHVVDIHPADKVTRRLDAMKTDADWYAQKDHLGAPLVPSEHKIPKEASAQFRDLLMTTLLPSPGDSASPDGVRGASSPSSAIAAGGLAQVRHASVPRRTLNLSHLPDGHTFGFHIEGGSTRFLSSTEAATHLQTLRSAASHQPVRLSMTVGDEQGIWPSITQWFSDRWNELTSFFCTIVNGVMTFVITIGKIIYEVVATLVSYVFQAIGLFLEKAFGLTMEKVVHWLGSFFDWDAIRPAYDAIKACVRQSPAQLVTNLQTLRTDITNSLIRATGHSPDALTRGAWPAQGPLSAVEKQRASTPLKDHHNSAASSPAVQWGSRTLSDNVSIDNYSSVNMATFAPNLDLSVIEQSLSTHFERLRAKVEQSLSKIDVGAMSLGDVAQLGFDTLKAVFTEIVDALFSVLESIASVLAEALDAFLKTTVDIPILSALHKEFIDKNAKTTTVLDLFCLIVAIPTTWLSKAMFGRPAFDSGKESSSNTALLRDDDAVTPEQLRGELRSLNASVIVAQFLSAVMATGIDLARSLGASTADPGSPVKPPDSVALAVARFALTIKLLVDTFGYACSMDAVATYRKLRVERSSREELDLAVVGLQLIFRLKDGYRLATWEQGPVSAGRAGAMESIGGVICLILTFVGLGLQSHEPESSTAELMPKTLSLFSLGLAQALSWPREAARVAAGPVVSELEVSLMTVRNLLFFAVPATAAWRLVVNERTGQGHAAIS